MAIGLGLMLGFVFPKNFNSPYIAKSITEFWRRWHISLSSWLRDYLYIPLGGNRHGEVRTYINLALVMLLGGLWHGSDWTFVIWGAIHGGWLALERVAGKKSFYRSLPGPFKMLLTFLIVNIAWVFFRTESLDHAWRYLGNMFGGGTVQDGSELIQGVIYTPYYAGSFVLAAIVTWTMPQTWDWTRKLTPIRAVIAIALFLLSILILETQSYNPFIYFIF
jgi:alginate O-acetyltransferase complex protein AlgI